MSVFVPIQKDSSGAEELEQFCSAALRQVDEQLSKCTCVSVLVSGIGDVLVAGCELFRMFCMQGDGISASSFMM